MARSDKFTVETAKIEYYSDFLTNFDRNPLTGFLARRINEETIKQALRNLILTQRLERFYQPGIGSKVYALLFEPMDTVTEEMLKEEIKSTIQNHEPRVSLVEVIVEGREDLNAYFVNVIFSIVNIPDQEFSLELIVKRVR